MFRGHDGPQGGGRGRFVSICEARRELGGISRTTFYDRVLPELERIAAEREIVATIRVGRRRMISRRVFELFIELLMRAGSWFFVWPLAAWHLFRLVMRLHRNIFG